MRLFVAIELPLEVRRAVEDLLEGLRRLVPDIRWGRAEGMHVTLKFLGEVDEARLETLSPAIERAAAASTGGFEIEIRGLGTFGGRHNPNVVWLGIIEPTGALRSLQAAVEAACESAGFAKEQRAYSPHLTLARPKARSRTLAGALEAHAGVRVAGFRVDACRLFQSLLRPDGAIHTPLRTYALAPPPAAAGGA